MCVNYVVKCIGVVCLVLCKYTCLCVCSCVGGTAGERSSSGLLEWESVNDAMEALAMMNHYQMKNPSKHSSYVDIQPAHFNATAL